MAKRRDVRFASSSTKSSLVPNPMIRKLDSAESIEMSMSNLLEEDNGFGPADSFEHTIMTGEKWKKGKQLHVGLDGVQFQF